MLKLLTTRVKPFVHILLLGVFFSTQTSAAPIVIDLTCSSSSGTNCPSGINSISEFESDLVSTIAVPTGTCIAGSITDVNVFMNISHRYVGDLIINLSGPSGSTNTLIDRPLEPTIPLGCAEGDINATFDDASSFPVENECNAPPPPAIGNPGNDPVSPTSSLASFNGTNIDGTWSLSIDDSIGGDEGRLIDWSLRISCDNGNGVIATATPTSIPTLSEWVLFLCILALGFIGIKFRTQ